jgi:GNAT superfamily N-acetyltransferase
MEGLVMIDAASYLATETLRDGRTITIRAQRPDDLDGWRAALARTSAETHYLRFFGPKRDISEKEAHYFLDIDFVKHVALVAIADEGGRPILIGGGRYIVIEPGKAEAAFALIDDYQGMGIGSALMRHLVAIGREAGLRELVAEVLSNNLAMLTVFERSGLPMNTRREGPVAHVTLRYS